MTQDIKISLSAKSLLQLVKCLKEAECAEFRYGDLSISFAQKPIEIEQTASTTGIELKAEQSEPSLDELMISDPVAYEEALNAKLEREH